MVSYEQIITYWENRKSSEAITRWLWHCEVGENDTNSAYELIDAARTFLETDQLPEWRFNLQQGVERLADACGRLYDTSEWPSTVSCQLFEMGTLTLDGFFLSWKTIVAAWIDADLTGRVWTIATLDELRKEAWNEPFEGLFIKAGKKPT